MCSRQYAARAEGAREGAYELSSRLGRLGRDHPSEGSQGDTGAAHRGAAAVGAGNGRGGHGGGVGLGKQRGDSELWNLAGRALSEKTSGLQRLDDVLQPDFNSSLVQPVPFLRQFQTQSIPREKRARLRALSEIRGASVKVRDPEPFQRRSRTRARRRITSFSSTNDQLCSESQWT